MTPKEVLAFYKSPHYFGKKTGMSASSLWNWLKSGIIPIASQKKLYHLSDGQLIPDLDGPIDKQAAKSYIASRNDVIDEVINRLEDMKKEGL